MTRRDARILVMICIVIVLLFVATLGVSVQYMVNKKQEISELKKDYESQIDLLSKENKEVMIINKTLSEKNQELEKDLTDTINHVDELIEKQQEIEKKYDNIEKDVNKLK